MPRPEGPFWLRIGKNEVAGDAGKVSIRTGNVSLVEVPPAEAVRLAHALLAVAACVERAGE